MIAATVGKESRKEGRKEEQFKVNFFPLPMSALELLNSFKLKAGAQLVQLSLRTNLQENEATHTNKQSFDE